MYWQNKQLEDLPNEIWVDAYGYEGIYSVSNLGRVKSEERRVPTFRGDRIVRARILSQAKSKDNRLTVNLSVNNIYKTQPINQLIYYSFYPEKLPNKEKSEVYHKNKIDYDNRLCNLSHNKNKGVSYKISIELGNVTHLEKARKKLHDYSYKTAIIKDGITTHRKCRVCGEVKLQIKYETYGRNICKDCRSEQKKLKYKEKKKQELK